MILFHVTTENYKVGDNITVEAFHDDFSYYHTNSPWSFINEYLDETKPDNEPSRAKCIYAFASLAHCAAFVRKKDNSNFYKVELNSGGHHPMCLTDAIRKTSDTESKHAMRTEYWNPTKKWKFNEYLGTEMSILEKIENVPAGYFRIQDDYMDDLSIISRTYI